MNYALLPQVSFWHFGTFHVRFQVLHHRDMSSGNPNQLQ